MNPPEGAGEGSEGLGGEAALLARAKRIFVELKPMELRERVQARAARGQALEQVTPIVTRLFEELTEPANVVERINTDATLDALHMKAALQLVLKRGLVGVVKPLDAVPAIRP